ncbi:MAG: hypothetical protein GKS04_00720 [Candidatus Mycalebacterium zealandia]|nr:MAG: hypothetical protein GKS04_00720 [Candidatus Mycalebacterium zealandia]
MNGFFAFFRMAALLIAVVFVASCSAKIPFLGKESPPGLEGLVPLSSSGLSTTKDVRADVVKLLMDSDDTSYLRKKIISLERGGEANWTNKKTGNAFTVRAISSKPQDEGGSRKVVIWGKKKGDRETVVKTYRYYY